MNAQQDSNSFKKGDRWPFDVSFCIDGVLSSNLHFSEGKAYINYNRKIGFIDTNFIIVIEPQFELGYSDRSYQFINNRAKVWQKRKCGLIDTTGKILLPCKYDKISNVGDYYYVEQDYKIGYLNSDLELVVPLEIRTHKKCINNAEVESFIQELAAIDSVENLLTVSKNEALRMAKSRGYYPKHNEFNDIILNINTGVWIIHSTESEGTTRKGHCAHTNGCIVLNSYSMSIDGYTGEILEKSKSSKLIPVYE